MSCANIYPRPFIVKEEEDQKILIDLDSKGNSPEDIVIEWHLEIKKLFSSTIGRVSKKNLLDMMKEYIITLTERAIHFEEIDKLQKMVDKHMEHIYWLFRDSVLYFSGEYLDYMEHILTFYVNLTLRVLVKRRKGNHRVIQEITRRIIKRLTFYLSRSEYHIFHVLIRQTSTLKDGMVKDVLNNLNWNICKQVFKNLYMHFLVITPIKDLSDEAFCRGFILFENWKALEGPSQYAQIEECMRLVFNRGPECIMNNEFLRKILVPEASVVTDLIKAVGCDLNITKAYFDYIKFKEKEEEKIMKNIENLNLEEKHFSNPEIEDEDDAKFREFYNILMSSKDSPHVLLHENVSDSRSKMTSLSEDTVIEISDGDESDSEPSQEKSASYSLDGTSTNSNSLISEKDTSVIPVSQSSSETIINEEYLEMYKRAEYMSTKQKDHDGTISLTTDEDTILNENNLEIIESIEPPPISAESESSEEMENLLLNMYCSDEIDVPLTTTTIENEQRVTKSTQKDESAENVVKIVENADSSLLIGPMEHPEERPDTREIRNNSETSEETRRNVPTEECICLDESMNEEDHISDGNISLSTIIVQETLDVISEDCADSELILTESSRMQTNESHNEIPDQDGMITMENDRSDDWAASAIVNVVMAEIMDSPMSPEMNVGEGEEEEASHVQIDEQNRTEDEIHCEDCSKEKQKENSDSTKTRQRYAKTTRQSSSNVKRNGQTNKTNPLDTGQGDHETQLDTGQTKGDSIRDNSTTTTMGTSDKNTKKIYSSENSPQTVPTTDEFGFLTPPGSEEEADKDGDERHDDGPKYIPTTYIPTTTSDSVENRDGGSTKDADETLTTGQEIERVTADSSLIVGESEEPDTECPDGSADEYSRPAEENAEFTDSEMEYRKDYGGFSVQGQREKTTCNTNLGKRYEEIVKETVGDAPSKESHTPQDTCDEMEQFLKSFDDGHSDFLTSKSSVVGSSEDHNSGTTQSDLMFPEENRTDDEFVTDREGIFRVPQRPKGFGKTKRKRNTKDDNPPLEGNLKKVEHKHPYVYKQHVGRDKKKKATSFRYKVLRENFLTPPGSEEEADKNSDERHDGPKCIPTTYIPTTSDSVENRGGGSTEDEDETLTTDMEIEHVTADSSLIVEGNRTDGVIVIDREGICRVPQRPKGFGKTKHERNTKDDNPPLKGILKKVEHKHSYLPLHPLNEGDNGVDPYIYIQHVGRDKKKKATSLRYKVLRENFAACNVPQNDKKVRARPVVRLERLSKGLLDTWDRITKRTRSGMVKKTNFPEADQQVTIKIVYDKSTNQINSDDKIFYFEPTDKDPKTSHHYDAENSEVLNHLPKNKSTYSRSKPDCSSLQEESTSKRGAKRKNSFNAKSPDETTKKREITEDGLHQVKKMSASNKEGNFEQQNPTDKIEINDIIEPEQDMLLNKYRKSSRSRSNPKYLKDYHI